MATRQQRLDAAMDRAVQTAQQRHERITIRNAVRDAQGADCRQCSGTGIRLQRIRGADGSISSMPQPCQH